jgi:hypothetical protein
MTDSAEMGERPADPATRGGVGVGAGTDDFVDGAAETEFESTSRTPDPGGASAPRQDDTSGAPGEAQTPFADTDAMANRMQPVDNWGTGDNLPQESPAEELENDT